MNSNVRRDQQTRFCLNPIKLFLFLLFRCGLLVLEPRISTPRQLFDFSALFFLKAVYAVFAEYFFENTSLH